MGRKICIVAPALKMGGMERASVNVANALFDEGYDIVFISLFKSEHFFKLNEGIFLYEPSNFNIKKLDLIKTLLWLNKALNKVNPDTILVFNKFYGAITTLAVLLERYKIYISERSSPFYLWDRKTSFINKIVYSIRPPDGIIAQTKIAEFHQRKYYRKSSTIKVIPNLLREVQLYPEIERQNWILAVGRLGDRLKGFDLLLEAYSKVNSPDWKLVFAGGDEDGQDLKEQAARLGILDRILFLGKVPDIDKVLATAKIFVIPSRSEGFPNALCEAMAAGLPCISFDFIAGPREIIRDGIDGIIVQDGNVSALAESIQILINDESKRRSLGDEALRIRQRLNKKRIVQVVASFVLGTSEVKY